MAQFGEEEAQRRRREEMEAKRVQDMATTSDIEQWKHDDSVANPLLDILASLRVEKQLEWSTSLGIQSLDVFTISTFETTLLEAIAKREGFNKGWDLDKYTVIIRACNSRATRSTQSIDDLSEVEWDKAVNVIR